MIWALFAMFNKLIIIKLNITLVMPASQKHSDMSCEYHYNCNLSLLIVTFYLVVKTERAMATLFV